MLAFLFFQDGRGDISGPTLSLTVSYSSSFLFNCFSRDPCGTKILFEEFLAKRTRSSSQKRVLSPQNKSKTLKKKKKMRAQEKGLVSIVV